MEGKSSPWGVIQWAKQIQEGIWQVSTAGHGGIKLERKQNAMMPTYLRNSGGWYEEDCEWAKPSVFFRLGDENEQEAAKSTLKNWFPDEYERFFGVVLQEGESRQRDEKLFHERHKNDYIAISAAGSWHENCPKGFVLVTAAIGGRKQVPPYDWDKESESQFLVPESDYDNNRSHFGFIVDPNKYQRVA